MEASSYASIPFLDCIFLRKESGLLKELGPGYELSSALICNHEHEYVFLLLSHSSTRHCFKIALTNEHCVHFVFVAGAVVFKHIDSLNLK